LVSYTKYDQAYGTSKRAIIAGINGIGVIHQVNTGNLHAYLAAQRRTQPDDHVCLAHDRSEYLPITDIEPSIANAMAVGFGMAHETNHYSAVLRRFRMTGCLIGGPATT